MSGAYCTANGYPVISGTIARPRLGAWWADLRVEVADPAAVTGPVTIALGTGSQAFVGTARRVGVYRDATHVRVVGGRGGLARTFGPKAYRGVPLRLPLLDVLAAAGEALAPTSDTTALSTTLVDWQGMAQPAGAALASLVQAANGSPAWRVLPDGTVWVGPEAWTASRLVAYDLTLDEPHLGRLELAADDPAIAPGQTFLGRRVSYVEHLVAPDQLRHLVWFEDQVVGPLDRVKGPLAAWVRSVFARIDYLARYPARVVAQNASTGALELVPDDPRLPGMSAVPIRYGVPGLRATVAPGARVLVGFAGGDPSKPEAELWESASVTKLELDGTTIVLNGGSAKVARVGDTAAAGTTMATWVAAVHALLNGTGPASKGTLVAPTDFGVINSGANGVKA